MKQSLGLLALCIFAPLMRADFVSTYGDATVVTGPDGNPAWQLTSDSSGPDAYGGVYVTITGTLTPTTLTQLSADYVMLTGTFGGGAPRFSLSDGSNNEAWIYFGTPVGGGTFTDPNNGNTTYANTGNYADLSSPDVRVYSNDFGGDNSPNTGQTWAQFVALTGSTGIDFISLDLDGGFRQPGHGHNAIRRQRYGLLPLRRSRTREPRPDAVLVRCAWGCGTVLAAQAGSLIRRRFGQTIPEV